MFLDFIGLEGSSILATFFFGLDRLLFGSRWQANRPSECFTVEPCRKQVGFGPPGLRGSIVAPTYGRHHPVVGLGGISRQPRQLLPVQVVNHHLPIVLAEWQSIQRQTRPAGWQRIGSGCWSLELACFSGPTLWHSGRLIQTQSGPTGWTRRRSQTLCGPEKRTQI